MNIQSWIILILVLLAVWLSVRRVWRNQKSGKGSCSCCDKASTCQLRHQKFHKPPYNC
ncbi:MAG: FeoB-associated Cys-rich membrane protein [Sodaliphilus sp.]|nr:FeoB-associated Cys-rich membrane protein [Sodaliphilus sp.]